MFWFLLLAALLESTGYVFSLANVLQQSIEAVGCVSQGLSIGVRCSLQHLIEAIRCSF